MVRIRRILCPVDFSRCSRHALEQAIAVAREFDAEIVTLHSTVVRRVTDAVPAGAASGRDPTALPDADRVAQTALVRDFILDVDASGVSIQIMIARGDPVDAIVARAAAWDADLIVIGTHGRSGFERLVLGSVVEKVLRRARCPVLTVPRTVTSPTHGLISGRTLCPVDFSRASLRALDYATTLADSAGPGVNVLNVVELFEEGAAARSERPPDLEDAHARIKSAALDRLRNAIRRRVRARCSIKELVAVGRPCREILRVAAEERCELIVLGVESRSPADLMLFGSTTQHVVRRAACPVLTIRA